MRDTVRKARERLAKHGFVATVCWALASAFYYPVTRWLDHRFDRKYGTDTTTAVDKSTFDLDADAVANARNYQATPDRHFSRFLKHQNLDFSEYTFVDLGCGKGRTLLLASRLPFKRIVGVEIAPKLHSVCLGNVATYMAHFDAPQPPVEALCMDAKDYDFPDGNIFLYLNNPFSEHVVTQVVRKLHRAIRSTPRYVRIVYFHPVYIAPLLTLPNIRLVKDESFHSRVSINNHGRVVTFEIAPGDGMPGAPANFGAFPRRITKSAFLGA